MRLELSARVRKPLSCADNALVLPPPLAVTPLKYVTPAAALLSRKLRLDVLPSSVPWLRPCSTDRN